MVGTPTNPERGTGGDALFVEPSCGLTVVQLDAVTVHMRDNRRTASASRLTLDAARFSRRCRRLAELHADGRLTQLDDHAVLAAIAEIAKYRDRWQIIVLDAAGSHSPRSRSNSHTGSEQ